MANNTTIRETLSIKQLLGMLCDLKAFRIKAINEKLNTDIGIIDDDILSMEYRIVDKKNEKV